MESIAGGVGMSRSGRFEIIAAIRFGYIERLILSTAGVRPLLSSSHYIYAGSPALMRLSIIFSLIVASLN
jgi:hypothetical protein